MFAHFCLCKTSLWFLLLHEELCVSALVKDGCLKTGSLSSRAYLMQGCCLL